MARFPGIYDNSRYGANIAALLAQQGEIAARGAERSGEIWGNAISQLGQIGAGAIQEHQARAESKKRQLAFDQAVSSWDGKDPMSLYRSIAPHVGPDDAARFAAGMSQLIKVNQGEKPTPEGLKTVVKALKASRKVYGDEGMAERWPQAAQALQPFAPLLPGPIPEQYTSQVGDYIDAFDAEMSPGAKQEGAIVETVGPDGKPIKRRATEAELIRGVPVYKAPETEPKTLEQIEAEAEARARGSRKGAPDSMPTLSPTAESNIINRLSNQWAGAVKSTAEISRQVSLMEKGLDAARRGDMAAGSQAVLVTFQKILDPTSVVRESEYARSAAGQSLMARMAGAVEQLQKGGAGVPVSELEKFAKLAREMASGQTGYTRAVKERIGKVADRYQIPRELVVEDFNFDAQTQPTQPEALVAPKTWDAELPGGIKIRKKQ